MKYIYVICIAMLLGACKQEASEKATLTADQLTGSDHSAFDKIADTITYDVIIRNDNPDDKWTESCLAHLKREEFVNTIMEQIKAGTLTAYDYETNQPMPVAQLDSVKAENDNKMVIGKIQFTELWAYNKSQMQFYKKIHSAIFGYETYTPEGEVRGYKAAFRVFFK